MAKLTWRGKQATKIAAAAAIQALQQCASHLQGESAQQAPIDTGDLRANCSVSDLQRKGHRFWYKVGYNLPYAIVQHERLDFNHPKGGKAKYLEDPFNEYASTYLQWIQNAIREAHEKN